MELQRLDWPFPSRGLVTELDAKHIPADALSAVTNMYFPQPFLLRARGGIDSTYNGSGSDDVAGMYYWDHDAKLYHWDDAKHLYKNGTAVSGPSYNVTDACSFGVGATPTLIVCEADPSAATMHTYNGTAYATLTGTDVPKARRVLSRYGRLWGTRYVDYPHRVGCSAAGDHTTWSGAYGDFGWWDIAPGHDGEIVDWLDYHGRLYIWKERGLYELTGDGPTNVNYRRIGDADKVVAGTAADCGRGVLYATAFGVFPVGSPPQDEAYDLTHNVQASIQSVLSSGQAAYSPELSAYVVVVGTTTVWVSNNANRPDVWTQFTAPAAMSAVYEGNGLWFGATDGKVYKYDHDDYKDGASTAYTVSFETGEWDLGSKWAKKNVRAVEGVLNGGENATATVSLYKDGEGTAVDSTTLTADSYNVDRVQFNCRRLKMKIAYTARTGNPYFGGAVVRLKTAGDVL